MNEDRTVRYPTLDVFNPTCPSRLTLELLADKWAMLVIMALSKGIMRNGDLMRRLVGISQKMLTQTLRELECSGIVERHVYEQVPPKVEYKLTALGESLLVPMAVLRDWAYEHYDKVLAAREEANESA
jgi:DNA-binding HxlR family transcriptional regulator